MKHKWRFFGLFALYALVLSTIWFKLHAAYIQYPAAVSDWLLDIIAYSGNIVAVVVRDGKTYIRFPEYAPDRAYQTINMVFNVVPFVALTLATPRITWGKIGQTLALGLAALFILHVISITAIFFRVATTFFWKDAFYYFFATIMEALAPIILWLVFIGRNFIFGRRRVVFT